MGKIILIGSAMVGSSTAIHFTQNDGVVLKDNIMKQEKIFIEDTFDRDFEIKLLEEKIPSKFIGKPKNNFKK